LIATPLHSQNFITEKEGLITNNRRIVTKNMWFNGTSLSEKARRALENEKVTIVTHISGYIHTIYKDATIDKKAYSLFTARLREFLITDLTKLVFINFLRFKSKYKSLFQYECECSGKKRYISLEKMFEYEHTSKFNVSSETRAQLIKEIEGDEFHLSPVQGKILLNDVEEIIDNNHGKSLKEIEDQLIKFKTQIPGKTIQEMFKDLSAFISTDPKLPDDLKNYINSPIPQISVNDDRDKIIHTIVSHTKKSELSLLALYVYRQMDKIDWLPFVKAAIERNPVCFNDLINMSIKEVYEILSKLPDQSIYDQKRLALPDEVWNFRRGDGIEKALLLADIIIQRDCNATVSINAEDKIVILDYDGKVYRFNSVKGFRKQLLISDKIYNIK
jgi:hypothetical protein